jgi:hypothetical protein
MKTEGEDPLRSQRTSAKQARAMTRAINMVTDEFIENFSQTGKDTGPETAPKMSPVREALAERELRETLEEKSAEKPEFRGFAALMANANNPAKGSAFSRLLSEDHDQPEAPAPAQPANKDWSAAGATPSPETTADGAIIKVKDTVGKKRGLYTSCMQRPTAEQLQEAAVKFSRPAAQATAAPSAQAALRPTEASKPVVNDGLAPIVNAGMNASLHADGHTRSKSDVRRPAAVKSKMTCESNCPVAYAFGGISSVCQKFFAWCKNKFSR